MELCQVCKPHVSNAGLIRYPSYHPQEYPEMTGCRLGRPRAL